jgi:hypothetical protein
MTKVRTPDDSGNDYYFEPAKRRGKPRPFGTPNDLVRYRFREPMLTSGEEADLVRAAKAGDSAARDKLAQSFHRAIVDIASKYSGPPWDELVAAGLRGFCEALYRHDIHSNQRLRSKVKSWIRKYIQLAVQDWLKGGQAGETRADRYVRHNSWATAQQVADKVGCTLAQAEAAIQRLDAGRYSERHDTTESGRYDEDRDGNENYTAPAAASSHDMRGMYGCFSRAQMSPHLGFHECKSRLVDEAAFKARFANMVVQREPIPKPELHMPEYTIPINTASTASDSADWQSDMDRIEAAAAVRPQVWDERDHWCRWHRRSLLLEDAPEAYPFDIAAE